MEETCVSEFSIQDDLCDCEKDCSDEIVELHKCPAGYIKAASEFQSCCIASVIAYLHN